jgi:outer membrane biosynthesis protein TonB
MPTKKQVTDVGKKVVNVASGATPSGAAVQGGKSAARWALDKYRAYTKAKRDKKAAAEKAKNEARADELYGKGTAIKPEPAKPAKPVAKPTAKPEVKPVQTQDMKSTLERIRENKRKRAQQLKGT